MNWQRGLERISAVWWGFIALTMGGLGVAAAFEDSDLEKLGMAVLAVVATLILHRVTCWVIGGFFAPKGN